MDKTIVAALDKPTVGNSNNTNNYIRSRTKGPKRMLATSGHC